MPIRERPRRASTLMKKDPFTLRITLSKSGSARGELYMDDGVSYSHQQGQVIWREFIFNRRGRKENFLVLRLCKMEPFRTTLLSSLATVPRGDLAMLFAVHSSKTETRRTLSAAILLLMVSILDAS